jgi:(1->4)-alpha-D-glucan 1-alpha-D-glucosylmutase
MTADFTRNILQRAIKQIVASFPVYRTYIDMDGAQGDADRRDLDGAMTQARRGDLTIDSSVFDFLHRVLSGEVVVKAKSGFNRTAVLRFAMKLQQYSGPVMAKGLEDTAFYRYYRHVALNEVGGEPGRFGISANLFHKANASRAKNWPRAMLGTSTHDTKRGEDTRARLAVLSDVPEEWARLVNTWSRLLRVRRGDIEGNAPPDRNDEYLLYQLLVGSWPMELLEETATASLETYGKRLAGALEKSMREAKLHSTWTSPDTVYEGAMQALARDALDSSRGGFLASFLPFAQKIARLGVQNSIIQTVMKLTLPGIPDIYQGCEMWDLSLVDPDNRRPVDYELRAAALTELRGKLDTVGDRKALLAAMLESWQDAKIKLAVTTLLLDLRRTQEAMFDTGGYEALTIEGQKSERVLGYMRSGGGERVAVFVARFPGLRDLDPDWSGTTASLPEGRWTDWLTGRRYEGGTIDLASMFETLPAMVLRAA